MKKILLTSVFVFGLMLSGSAVDALTAKTSVTSPTLQYSETLRRGTKNANVLALQKKLQEFGYYNKALDSDYGSGTIAAVRQYQLSKGLVPDGNAGPNTYAMILADNSGLKTSANSSVSNNSVICTKEYVPVCGKNPMMSQPQTYGNTCLMQVANATLVSQGVCPKVITKLPNKGNVLVNSALIGLEPVVEEVSHMNVTNNSVQLHGEFDVYSYTPASVFFVYGQDDDLVEDVADDYDTYFDVNEDGQDLRKMHYLGFGQTGDFGITTGTIGGLESDEEYFYTACIEFTNSNNNQELVCGDVEEFETLSLNSGSVGCLDVAALPIPDTTLEVGDNNKIIGKFNLSHNCYNNQGGQIGFDISKMEFRLISSNGTPHFPDLDVYVNGYQYGNNVNMANVPYYGGAETIFIVEPVNGIKLNSVGNYEVIVKADINSPFPVAVSSNKGKSAFAISLNNAKYYTNPNPQYTLPVWNELITVDNF